MLPGFSSVYTLVRDHDVVVFGRWMLRNATAPNDLFMMSTYMSIYLGLYMACMFDKCETACTSNTE